MKNGTTPILTRVGGLADFVEDGKTGFLADLVLHEIKVDTDVDKLGITGDISNASIGAWQR